MSIKTVAEILTERFSEYTNTVPAPIFSNVAVDSVPFALSGEASDDGLVEGKLRSFIGYKAASDMALDNNLAHYKIGRFLQTCDSIFNKNGYNSGKLVSVKHLENYAGYEVVLEANKKEVK